MSNKRFSIDLGPELDSPYEKEWGWMEDEDPEQPLAPNIRMKRDRTTNAKLNKRWDKQAKDSKRKPPPSRELPSPEEAAMEPEPEPTELDDAMQDLHLDAIHDIAQEQDQRTP